MEIKIGKKAKEKYNFLIFKNLTWFEYITIQKILIFLTILLGVIIYYFYFKK